MAQATSPADLLGIASAGIVEGGNRLVEWTAVSSATDRFAHGLGWIVQPYGNGVLLAVVDAVGRDPGAVRTASVAVSALTARASSSVESLVTGCHGCLLGSRGATIAVASLRADGSLTWLAVGNTSGLLLPDDGSPPHSLVQRGGIVGDRIAPLRADALSTRSGDLVVLATCGIRGVENLPRSGEPSRLACEILDTRASTEADAVVVVARAKARV